MREHRAGGRRPGTQWIRRAAILLGPAIVVAGLASAGLAQAAGTAPAGGGAALAAVPDRYTARDTGTLAVGAGRGVLANDHGRPLQIVSHTDPAHGSLTFAPDGSLQYVPQAGFTGDDTFTYTVTNAVQLYTDHLPSLGTFGGVSLNAGGFGSSLYPDPGHPGMFYGLEDRGPNVGAPDGSNVEPVPTFDPAIGLFTFASDGRAVLQRQIPLRDSAGHPYSGLVGTQNPTGETIEDLERPRPGPGPGRLRLRGPCRDEGRHVLGVGRVRAVHHPLQPGRPADPAAVAVQRGTASRAGQPGAEQGHGGPDDHPGRDHAGRHDAVRAAAARPGLGEGNQPRAGPDRHL